jgi:Domain of unknown function (DUF4118)
MYLSIKMRSVHRRMVFLFHYLLARAGAKSISRLLPIVEESFSHPWVSGVELKLRFWPGKEATRPRLWRSSKPLPRTDLMHWDAPVTVAIFRRRKGKERQALCLSFYIRSGILYIAQMQGVMGTDIPEELRPWPRMFIEACKKFARQEGLREIRVAKASTLVSFLNPYGKALTEAREKVLPRIRRDMELIYDRNALELGLVPNGAWFRWRNPSAIQDYHPAILQRAAPVAASLVLVAAITVILSQLHATQTGPSRLVYFYLLPLGLISLLCTEGIAIISAGAAILCADYFLQDPVFSLYTSEWADLIGFGVLVMLEIEAIQKLFLRANGGGTAIS